MIYVASRVHHAPMWRELRRSYPIISTWIDETESGDTDDFCELWGRIESEVRRCVALVLWVQEEDFPLKGALVEVGMAMAFGKRVFVAADVELEPRSMRPLGSWLNHPLVTLNRGSQSLHASIWLAHRECLSQEQPHPSSPQGET